MEINPCTIDLLRRVDVSGVGVRCGCEVLEFRINLLDL